MPLRQAGQNKRLWLAGSALTAAVITLITWFAAIGPLLSSASALNTETDSVEAQNTVLQAKIATLKKQKQALPRLTASLRRALTALPLDSGLPEFTRQITQQAQTNNITLTSITVGAINPVIETTPTPPTDEKTDPEKPTEEKPDTPTPPPTPSTDGPAGKIFTIRITLVTTGTAPNQTNYLKTLQTTGPRRALIASTQLIPTAGPNTTPQNTPYTMTTELTIFTAPQTPENRTQLQKLLTGNTNG